MKKNFVKKIGDEVLKIDSRKMIAVSEINGQKKVYKIVEIVFKPQSINIAKIPYFLSSLPTHSFQPSLSYPGHSLK